MAHKAPLGFRFNHLEAPWYPHGLDAGGARKTKLLAGAPLAQEAKPLMDTQPNLRSVLESLTHERLLDLGRVTGAGLKPSREAKRGVVGTLAETLGEQRLPEGQVNLSLVDEWASS